MIRWGSGGRRRVLAIASIAAAVVVIGGAATAVTLTEMNQNHTTASRSGSPSFKAVATVTPPVSASKCATPTAFTYSGVLSAAAPGTVKYQWVYSSRKPGPVRTLTFTRAGHKAVTGETVKSGTAGSGWGEIKMISPAAQTSNQATYKLVCGSGSVGGITATAAVTPAARTVSCVTAPPAFTATGSISASKAERVTYHWARPGGANSAPATLTFTKPGTKAVKPLTITPPRASGSGKAVLVVTSPVSTASSPATYTLTCTSPTTQPATNQTPPPAGSTTPPPASYPPVPHTMSVTVNAPTTTTVGQPYSGTVTATGGDGNYTWSAASKLPPGLTATANGATLTISGTPTALGQWTPYGYANDGEYPAATAAWSLVITVSETPVTITNSAPVSATVGQPYSGTLTATGGEGSYTWSTASMLLPPGLTATANGATLTISGTPTVGRTFIVTADVSDSYGGGGTATFAIVVSPAP